MKLEKFDNIKRTFITAPWHGGYGLAPVDRPIIAAAIPERRPGKRVETEYGVGTVVQKHVCSDNFWTDEGVLVDGIFYQYAA